MAYSVTSTITVLKKQTLLVVNFTPVDDMKGDKCKSRKLKVHINSKWNSLSV